MATFHHRLEEICGSPRQKKKKKPQPQTQRNQIHTELVYFLIAVAGIWVASCGRTQE